MLKFSKLIENKGTKMKVLQEARTRLHFQKKFESLISSIVDCKNLEDANIKYFLKDMEKNFCVKIKTSNPIHCVILKTEVIKIEQKTQEILSELRIIKSPKVIIL